MFWFIQWVLLSFEKRKLCCRTLYKTCLKRDLKGPELFSAYGQRELFSGLSGPQNSAINFQGIMSVFLLFFSRDMVYKILVETNLYAEQFINSRGRIFTFRSFERQRASVTANKFHIVFCIY
jgi:hypothetical protein